MHPLPEVPEKPQPCGRERPKRNRSAPYPRAVPRTPTGSMTELRVRELPVPEQTRPAVTPETGADGALTGGSAAATAVGATEGVSETGFAADSLDACTGYAAGAKETGCSALVLLVLVEASNDAGADA